MPLGKLGLTLIPLALLALGLACAGPPSPAPTPLPTATPQPAPTATASPTPTAQPTSIPTPPYPFPEEVRAIGDHRDDDSWPVSDDAGLFSGFDGNPYVIYGCFIGYAGLLGLGAGEPLFTHTGEIAFDPPNSEISRTAVAQVSKFESPRGILDEGQCYKMAVLSFGGKWRMTTDITRARAPKFDAFTYDLIHPNMWKPCGRAPLPELADIRC